MLPFRTNSPFPSYLLFTFSSPSTIRIAPKKEEKGLPKFPSPAILANTGEVPPRPPASTATPLSEAGAGAASSMPKTMKERNAVLRRKISMFKKTRSAQEVEALKLQLRMQARIRREQAHMFETTAAGERKVVIPRPPVPPN
jgi:hypothetical protein